MFPVYGKAHLQVGLETRLELQSVGKQFSGGVEYVSVC